MLQTCQLCQAWKRYVAWTSQRASGSWESRHRCHSLSALSTRLSWRNSLSNLLCNSQYRVQSQEEPCPCRYHPYNRKRLGRNRGNFAEAVRMAECLILAGAASRLSVSHRRLSIQSIPSNQLLAWEPLQKSARERCIVVVYYFTIHP